MTFAPEWLTGSPSLVTTNWLYLWCVERVACGPVRDAGLSGWRDADLLRVYLSVRRAVMLNR